MWNVHIECRDKTNHKYVHNYDYMYMYKNYDYGYVNVFICYVYMPIKMYLFICKWKYVYTTMKKGAPLLFGVPKLAQAFDITMHAS